MSDYQELIPRAIEAGLQLLPCPACVRGACTVKPCAFCGDTAQDRSLQGIIAAFLCGRPGHWFGAIQVYVIDAIGAVLDVRVYDQKGEWLIRVYCKQELDSMATACLKAIIDANGVHHGT